jgi:ribosomal protein S14
MNTAKGHLFGRARVEYTFRTIVDRTIHERRHEERRLAEQRATKHKFQARNSCILDGRNYRIAHRLLLLARAQF